jgi:hypothetical protein
MISPHLKLIIIGREREKRGKKIDSLDTFLKNMTFLMSIPIYLFS